MLGLRPTLKPRPSLLDLVFHTPQSSSTPSRPSTSPAATPPSLLESPLERRRSQSLKEQKETTIGTENTKSMAKDSERKRQEAGEDQYGAVFSVSGPVIVAENMIGCAMYELVSYGSTSLMNHLYVLTVMV